MSIIKYYVLQYNLPDVQGAAGFETGIGAVTHPVYLNFRAGSSEIWSAGWFPEMREITFRI